MTAPEFETIYDKYHRVKYYYVKDVRLGVLQDNWTLVEEEPEKLHIDKPRGYKLVSEDATANGFNQPKEPNKISWANRLKERLENMTQEEFEKAMNEMYVDGDESPTLEEYLKAAYHSPIQDFKAGAEWQKKQFSDILDKWEEHAMKGMRLGASAYHQGKIALICDLRDWIKEQTQKTIEL
jgi:hypothetical protein